MEQLVAFCAIMVTIACGACTFFYLSYRSHCAEMRQAEERERIANLPANRRRRSQMRLAHLRQEVAHLEEEVEALMKLELQGESL